MIAVDRKSSLGSPPNPNGVDNTCKDVFDYVTGELPGYQAKVQLHLSANNIQSTDITSSTDLIMCSIKLYFLLLTNIVQTLVAALAPYLPPAVVSCISKDDIEDHSVNEVTYVELKL